MKNIGLSSQEIALVLSVFCRFSEITTVILFGSRAKGTHRSESDIDLAIVGIDDPLQVQAIAEELDELPLPYQFDVVPYNSAAHQPLRQHIDRVGEILYDARNTS